MENLRVMMITAKEAINTLVQTLKKKKKLYIHKRERKFGTEVVTLMLLYWFLWEVETINLFGGESKSGVIWKSFSNFSVLNFFPWKKIVLNAPVNEDTTFLQLCFSLPRSLWVGVSAHFVWPLLLWGVVLKCGLRPKVYSFLDALEVEVVSDPYKNYRT